MIIIEFKKKLHKLMYIIKFKKKLHKLGEDLKFQGRHLRVILWRSTGSRVEFGTPHGEFYNILRVGGADAFVRSIKHPR